MIECHIETAFQTLQFRFICNGVKMFICLFTVVTTAYGFIMKTRMDTSWLRWRANADKYSWIYSTLFKCSEGRRRQEVVSLWPGLWPLFPVVSSKKKKKQEARTNWPESCTVQLSLCSYLWRIRTQWTELNQCGKKKLFCSVLGFDCSDRSVVVQPSGMKMALYSLCHG